ncbi:MAG: hypothetical protein MUE53_03185 [Chitinophagales bacterium]|nr:hypothetical protein [Chitinophagales bacterium]
MKNIFLCVFFTFFFISCEDRKLPDITGDVPYELNIPAYFPKPNIPLDNPLTTNKVALGRMLFYDPILSIDSSLSCASCHKQRFAFADSSAKNRKVSHQLTTRNSMPLFNLVFQDNFFWDGREKSIESATVDALIDEMQFNEAKITLKLAQRSVYRDMFKKVFGNEDYTQTQIAQAISSFIRTMVSHNSRLDKGLKEGNFAKYLSDLEVKGKIIFDNENGDCFHCHGQSNSNLLFTNLRFHNNALDEVVDISGFEDLGLGKITKNPIHNGTFRTPSLRNISYTAPYMHDGRFQTLDEVLNHYSSGLKNSPTADRVNLEHIDHGGVQLTPEEFIQLKAFIKTLDDPEFIQDPKFSNPFK